MDFKILLVDDESSVKTNISTFLHDKLDNTSIDYAINGKCGLDLASKNNYDIIIVDIFMPEMNGLDMIDSIPKSKKTHIIAFTGYDASAFDSSRLIGKAELIYKFDIKKLINRIKEIYTMNSFRDKAKKLTETVSRLYVACSGF